MEPKKITYTVTWTQDPQHWDIHNTVKLLEEARNKIVQAQEAQIETNLQTGDYALANQVISKIRAM